MMRISTKNKTCFANFWDAVVFAAVPLCQISTAFAAEIITPNPQQQGLPSIQREEVVPRQEAPEQESQLQVKPALADQVLPFPIRQVVLQSPLFSKEIDALLAPFIGKTKVSGKDLEEARGQIWELYRQYGRLANVELHLLTGTEETGGTLEAQVTEIRVRSIKVEQTGDSKLKQSLLDDILSSAKADIAEGGVLDLNRLDSRIKRRLFLKDVAVRATLVPVDADHVDVEVLVSANPVTPLSWLAQYDNSGLRTYGRNRYLAGVSIPGRMLAGDQIDVLGLANSNMTYAHLAYEFPVVNLGSRLKVWGSHIDYKVPSVSKGYATLLGMELSYPLYIDNASVWTGYLNYTYRHEIGDLANNFPTANKVSNSVQGKVATSYFLSPAQTLHFSTAVTFGNLDLSALASAIEQDAISAKTAGDFTKLEWDGSWNMLFGPTGKLDARIGTMGQFASKNLDQSEKFALGGPLHVRAYGPSEALGDDAYMASAELGYRPINTLRTFVFYDVGHTRLYKQPWGTQAAPSEYTLQGAGVGLSYSYQSLVGSVTYAHQIGTNPGLSSAGLDSEGLSNRYRLWLSLTWRM